MSSPSATAPASARPPVSPRGGPSLRAGLLRLGELLAAVILAVSVSTLTLLVVNRGTVPEPSYVDDARLSFVTISCVLAIAAVAWLHHRSRSTSSGVIAWVVSTISLGVIGTGQLAALLRGTPHYLFGLSGDQSFRVPYLARLAESAGLRDVFYLDAIPYYPPLWFWLGGRYANLTGLEGWEAYKPFALATMSAVAAIVFVGWRWLVGAGAAGFIAAATTAVGVHFNAYEPYSWGVVAVVPLLCIWTVRTVSALIDAPRSRAALRSASGPALVIGVVLGLAAMTYTVVAAVACLSVAVSAAAVAVARVRSRAAGVASALWLVLTGLVTLLVALLYWGRYVFALLTGTPHAPSVAADFLPEQAATLPLPFLEQTIFGLVSLLGLVVLTVAGGVCWRAWRRFDPGHKPGAPLVISTGLLIAAATGYLWTFASLAFAFTNSTLLSFRMIPMITLALVLGAVYWLCEVVFRGEVVTARLSGWSTALAPTAAVLVVLLTAGMVQSIGPENEQYAPVAHGSDPSNQAELLGAFDEMVPDAEARDTVVLTAEPKLLAYRDVFTFQAPGREYATPFARYPERSEEIRRFAAARTPQELIAALDSSEFVAPEVFILNRDQHGISYPLKVNQLPVTGGRTHEAVYFQESAFADPELFEHRTVGQLEIYVRR